MEQRQKPSEELFTSTIKWRLQLMATQQQEQALQELSDFGQEMDRQFRNEVLEEVAVEIEKLRGDTAASFAVFVRNMKR